MRPSAGFLSSLAGLTVTFFSWFSSSAWPAWPAVKALELFDHGGFAELSSNGRAAVTVLLIALNVTVWAFFFRGTLWLARTIFRKRPLRRPISPSE